MSERPRTADGAQRVARGGGEEALARLLAQARAARPMLVCDGAFALLPCARWRIAAAPRFDAVTANPRIETVWQGVGVFRENRCDALVAIGGGSAMDVAKGIRAFCREESGEGLLRREVKDSGVPLLAVPTTAGTGSESTHFAVLYEGGVKHSLAHESLLPGYVLLDGGLLRTLPLYQKKCTLLDALCQGIESYWAKRATAASRALAARAIRGVLDALEDYLTGDGAAAQRMLESANLSGQAINLTTTTAAHAMSYGLTSRYGLPHGHAVAVCLPPVWRRLLAEEALRPALSDLAALIGAPSAEQAPARFAALLTRLQIAPPAIPPDDLDALAVTVNAQRLGNHPQSLDRAALRALYAALASENEA